MRRRVAAAVAAATVCAVALVAVLGSDGRTDEPEPVPSPRAECPRDALRLPPDALAGATQAALREAPRVYPGTDLRGMVAVTASREDARRSGYARDVRAARAPPDDRGGAALPRGAAEREPLPGHRPGLALPRRIPRVVEVPLSEGLDPAALAAAQAALAAGVVAIGGVLKLIERDRSPHRLRSRSALGVWVSAQYIAAATHAVALVEIAVAALVLAGLWRPWSEVALLVLSVLFLLGLLATRRRAPGAPCGCMGSRSDAPIGARSLARTSLLAPMAACGVAASPHWTAILESPVALAVLLLEAGAIAALYPELRPRDGGRLDKARCAARRLSTREALAVLRASSLWSVSRGRHLLSDAPADAWREGCWRLLAFPARHPAGDAVAVFAIHAVSRQPLERMTLVLRDDDQIVEHVAAPDAP
jgi:hypothetical protein